VVHQEVDRLPARYRRVVVLCDLQGESYESAAARLRVPVGTVRSRLSRARDRLRGQLIRRGLALPGGAGATLATSEASAAVPARLIASTIRLANLAEASGLAGVAGSTPALALARGVLRAGGWNGIGKAGAALAGVVVGLAGAGVFAPGGNLAAIHPPVAEAQPAPRVAAQAAPPAPTPPRGGDPLQDLPRLQGRWVVVAGEQHGAPLDLVVGDRLVIEGDRFLWTAERGEPERIFRRGTTRGTIALEPGADPRRIDLLESGRTLRAIYRLLGDEDQLTLCLSDPDVSGPPRRFTSEPGSRTLLLVFRREASGVRRGVPFAPDHGATGKDRP
jgi:uncharacterized protein (TIGR03067 family)